MKTTQIRSLVLLAVLSVAAAHSAEAQIKATTECYPSVTKSVCGVTEFERERFINLAGSSREAEIYTSTDQREYLFEELEVKFGRGLGMVESEHKYSNSLREDKKRRGYTDLEHLRKHVKRNEPETDYFTNLFGASEDMALHDARDIYPPYIEQFNATKVQERYNDFPVNADAGGELVANVLKYKFSDFTRPKYYEAVNEPHWESWADKRFVEMHTAIKRHVDLLGLDVKVGGPCLSVSNFYANNYGNMHGIVRFIDDSNFELDFYSFHSYDYYTWNRDSKEFEGKINSGAPLEGVFDALASYTYNKYGRELKYVATEHGGYMPGKSYGRIAEGPRKEAFDYYADTYFPGSGFGFDVERRSVDNFLMLSSAIANTMVFMNQPHIVLKAIPFILMDTSSWDPYYYATLMVRDNFEKGATTAIFSPLIYFYEFFKGVEGRITHSWCDSGDIQHLAYSNDDGVVLLYHNMSNEHGEIAININEFDQKISGATIRRVGREDDSHKPYLNESKMVDYNNFTIAPQESVAIFLTTEQALKPTRNLDEVAHYASEQNVQFSGMHTFDLHIDEPALIEDSFLRIGINRKNKIQDGITIRLNGVELQSEKGFAADRYTGDHGYTTTRIIHLPKGTVAAQNKVEVSFADGGEGGVGAVVLRAQRSDNY